MTKIKGSNILITGGGSGIGKAMGNLALKKGAKHVMQSKNVRLWRK